MIEVFKSQTNFTEGFFTSRNEFFGYLESKNVRYVRIDESDYDYETYELCNSNNEWICDVSLKKGKVNRCKSIEWFCENEPE